MEILLITPAELIASCCSILVAIAFGYYSLSKKTYELSKEAQNLLRDREIEVREAPKVIKKEYQPGDWMNS